MTSVNGKTGAVEIDRDDIGLGNVDNTSDADKPVSTAQQALIDALHQQLTAYADKLVADLIGGAPSTLDTLGEIAKAMQESGDVVAALEKAIGTKADAAEFDTLQNTALLKDGDSKDNTVSFTSSDVADGSATSWTNVAKITSKEKHSSLWAKVSQMFKNVRYLYKMLGTTDIAKIGGGTVTGAISALNADMAGKQKTVTGAATTIVSSNLTASMALVSDTSGKVAASKVTAAELGCLTGLSSNVQTQINNANTQFDKIRKGVIYETDKPLGYYSDLQAVCVWSDAQAKTSMEFPQEGVAGMTLVFPTYLTSQKKFIYVTQVYIARDNSFMYVRIYDHNTDKWSAWKKIY